MVSSERVIIFCQSSTASSTSRSTSSRPFSSAGDQHPGAIRSRGRQDLQVHPGLGRDGGVVRRLGGADDASQLAVQIATDQELWVEHLADAPALAKHLHRHRVDQERPVVGDDLHHGRPTRGPSVVSLARRTDRDHRPGSRSVLRRPIVAGHQAQQVLDSAFVHVDRVDVAEVVPQEDLYVVRILAELPGQPGRSGGNGRDLLGLLLLQLDLERGHVTPHRSRRPHSAVRLTFDPSPVAASSGPGAPLRFRTLRLILALDAGSNRSTARVSDAAFETAGRAGRT